MPNISAQIKIIQNAYRGEEVRDAIIDLVNIMNEVDAPIRPADLLVYVKSGVVKGQDLFASTIVPGSKQAPKSSAIYDAITTVNNLLDGINGEVV